LIAPFDRSVAAVGLISVDGDTTIAPTLQATSMTRYILALDQGTTSSRSILFDHSGSIKAMAQREFTQHFPQPGWVEHDADEIWASQLATIHEVMVRAGIQANEIAALGITNQRETTVLWDKATGRPLAPAIVWQDRRTATSCEALKAAGHEARVCQITGLMLDPYFSGTKLAWLLDHTPGARLRAERGELAFGTIDSWLIYQLSGTQKTHVTDFSNASRTLMMDLATGQWSDEMLALLNVPRACLPRIVPSQGLVTEIELLGQRIPLAGIAGDQQAALFGQACFKPGMAKNTYGTGCFLLMNVGTQPVASKNRQLSTAAWDVPQGKQYALEGAVFVGGAVVQWLRDNLKLFARASDIEALAGSVNHSDGVVFVPAFTGLGSPHWDPHARGALFGLTRGTTPAHIARAALESIALQSADLLRGMQADSSPMTELRVDGGATSNNLLMQIQANVLGVPVVRPKVTETTALGAAYLAGLAVGFWPSTDELSKHWQEDRRFEPAISADERGQQLEQWGRAIHRSRDWAT
jgi:glycerol kinase